MSSSDKNIEPVTSSVMAHAILQEFVANTLFDAPPGLTIEADTQSMFRAKNQLYRLSLALMVLMAEEQRDPKLASVRHRLEEQVFTMPPENGAIFLEQLRLAMQKLNELLFPEDNPREMSWAKTWFEDIGVNITDPIGLALFAKGWMEQYKMVTHMIRDTLIQDAPPSAA